MIDALILNDELELLDLRLHTLDEVVDYFVICEGDTTFSGQPKPLHFKENAHRFREFKHKIVYHAVREWPTTVKSRWDREHWQRRELEQTIAKVPDLSSYDMVHVSDADEIPRPNVLRTVSCVGSLPAYLEEDNFYYYLNLSTHNTIKGPFVSYWHTIQHQGIQALRCDQNICPERVRVIPRAGWHFSCMGGPDRIVRKLESFSHAEIDTPEIKSQVAINVAQRQDLIGRPWGKFSVLPLDDDFPSYLLEQRERFRDMLLEE